MLRAVANSICPEDLLRAIECKKKEIQAYEVLLKCEEVEKKFSMAIEGTTDPLGTISDELLQEMINCKEAQVWAYNVLLGEGFTKEARSDKQYVMDGALQKAKQVSGELNTSKVTFQNKPTFIEFNEKVKAAVDRFNQLRGSLQDIPDMPIKTRTELADMISRVFFVYNQSGVSLDHGNPPPTLEKFKTLISPHNTVNLKKVIYREYQGLNSAEEFAIKVLAQVDPKQIPIAENALTAFKEVLDYSILQFKPRMDVKDRDRIKKRVEENLQRFFSNFSKLEFPPAFE